VKGALLYAFNNERVDYVKLAKLAAQRVHKFWDIPTCIVSDAPRPAKLPKGIVFWKEVERPTVLNTKPYHEYGTALSYWNTNRHEAFSITPFTQTILLDVDFLVSTSNIVDAWSGNGIALTKQSYTVDGFELPADCKWLSLKNKIEMYWATVICFDKSPLAQEFFARWANVVRMYSVYSTMYGFDPAPVRNDFAVTIALQMMKGSSENGYFDLPYSIPTLTVGSMLQSLDPLIALTDVRDEECEMITIHSDLHVMNKKSILECAVDTTLNRKK
jgi:hypothetical protein